MDTRLKIAGGEINVSSDEINLMPESTRDLFAAMIGQFTSGEPCVISGCNRHGNNSDTVTEGYVFLNGKLLKVDQHTILDFGTTGIGDFEDKWRFEETTITDIQGIRDFRDGNQNNVYLKERAVIREVANPTGLIYNYNLIEGTFVGVQLGSFMSTNLGGSTPTDNTLVGSISRPRNKPIDFGSLGIKHLYTSDFEVSIEFSTSHFSIPTGGIDLRVLWKFSSSNNLVITDYDNQNVDSNGVILLPEPTNSGIVEAYWLFQRLSDGALNEL